MFVAGIISVTDEEICWTEQDGMPGIFDAVVQYNDSHSRPVCCEFLDLSDRSTRRDHRSTGSRHGEALCAVTYQPGARHFPGDRINPQDPAVLSRVVQTVRDVDAAVASAGSHVRGSGEVADGDVADE